MKWLFKRKAPIEKPKLYSFSVLPRGSAGYTGPFRIISTSHDELFDAYKVLEQAHGSRGPKLFKFSLPSLRTYGVPTTDEWVLRLRDYLLIPNFTDTGEFSTRYPYGDYASFFYNVGLFDVYSASALKLYNANTEEHTGILLKVRLAEPVQLETASQVSQNVLENTLDIIQKSSLDDLLTGPAIVRKYEQLAFQARLIAASTAYVFESVLEDGVKKEPDVLNPLTVGADTFILYGTHRRG